MTFKTNSNPAAAIKAGFPINKNQTHSPNRQQKKSDGLTRRCQSPVTGLSPMRRIRSKLLSGALALSALIVYGAGTPLPAQTATPLKYHGGPILTSFTVYPLYFGNWTDTTAETSYLNALAKHMSGQDAPPGQQPVIWQYGVNQVSVAPGVISSQPSILPARTVTDADIVNIIYQNQQPTTKTVCVATQPGSKPACHVETVAPPKLPAYGPATLIVVLLAPEYPLNCGANCGAYHSSRSSVSYYAAVPHYDDFGLQNIKLSHEVFEAAANPAIGANTGWDELSDGCPGVQLSFGSVTQAHDNTIGGNCSPTGYIRPATLSSSAASSQPAYVRSDQVNSVLYVGYDNHIHELYLAAGSTAWQQGDLFPASSTSSSLQATGHPTAYVRSDGVNSVAYRGVDNDIHELSLRPGGAWQSADLVHLTNAHQAAGDPAAYRRFDNVNSVVYRDVYGHISELYLTPGSSTWQESDLSAQANAPSAAGDPVVYIRFDGTNTVVYRGNDNHFHELYLKPGASTWQTDDLFANNSASLATGNPAAYVRLDGINSVVYRGTDNHIHELYLSAGTTWQTGDLSAQSNALQAAGNPAAYVRFDGVNSVVYRGTDNHIHELYLTPRSTVWQTGDLFAKNTALSAWADPTAYRRLGNVNSVVYRSSTDIEELSLASGGQAWQIGDLSSQAGAPPAR